MTVKELINKLTELPEDTELDSIGEINIPKITYLDPIENFFVPDVCRNCPNHPSNGGTGMCHCVLGTQTVY